MSIQNYKRLLYDYYDDDYDDDDGNGNSMTSPTTITVSVSRHNRRYHHDNNIEVTAILHEYCQAPYDTIDFQLTTTDTNTTDDDNAIIKRLIGFQVHWPSTTTNRFQTLVRYYFQNHRDAMIQQFGIGNVVIIVTDTCPRGIMVFESLSDALSWADDYIFTMDMFIHRIGA